MSDNKTPDFTLLRKNIYFSCKNKNKDDYINRRGEEMFATF